jgi:hypothetical protein
MVDLYCERVDPGLWSEPVNALTNVAFFLAAWATWNLARRAQAAVSTGSWLLVVLLVTIGIGSSVFHTFATTWARVFDVVPILLFQVSYLWLYSREIMKMKLGFSVGLLGSFLVAAYFGRQFPHILNGSLIYAPAFLLILGLGLYHYRAQKAERVSLLAAAGVFLVAICFRTIDNAVCSSFPVGTHFLWHLLIPVVLYLFMRSLLLNLTNTSPTLDARMKLPALRAAAYPRR